MAVWPLRLRAHESSLEPSAIGRSLPKLIVSIRADAGPVLDAQAAWLSRYSGVGVRIEGNADERGTREYNLALGARRASAVRDYLTSRGVSAGRITTVSYGKEQPIDGGTSEESYQRNRNAHTSLTSGAR